MPNALPVVGEGVDGGAVVPGDDAADPGRGAVQRGGLAVDRREVAGLGAAGVVGVPQLFDLAFAQPADGARQQTGDLGTERRGDLRRTRQQEVAGEDRLQVAPLGVDRVHAAAGVGFVHDVVVIERAEVHELAGHTAAHDVVADAVDAQLGADAGDLCRDDGQHRPQPLASGDDQVRGDLGEVRIGGLHGVVHRHFDAGSAIAHAVEQEQRRCAGRFTVECCGARVRARSVVQRHGPEATGSLRRRPDGGP